MPTLEELKAQNKAKEEAADKAAKEAAEAKAKADAKDDANVAEEDAEEDANAEENSEGDDKSDDDKSGNDDETPDWAKVDKPEHLDADGKPKKLPVNKLLKVKKKLKGRILEKDEELKAAQREIARLRASAATGGTPNKGKETDLPKRPNRKDYKTDAAFELANDNYNDKFVEITVNRVLRESSNNAGVETAKATRAQSVTDHYVRGANLIAKNGISEEAYQKADATFRTAIEEVMPNQGDAIADQLIENMGKGSEKVCFHLGINEEKLAKFQGLLRADVSGIKAAIYLGQEQKRLTKPIGGTSNARGPANDAGGDNKTSVEAVKLLKRYKAFHRKGEAGEAFNIKQQAKKSGVDVSDWINQ